MLYILATAIVMKQHTTYITALPDISIYFVVSADRVAVFWLPNNVKFLHATEKCSRRSYKVKKGKGKVVPVLNLIKHYAMKAYGGVDV
jgi:hypothetical protein